MSLTARSALVGAVAVSVLGAGVAVAAPASALPSITRVTFAGQAGPGVASPTVTITGNGFGTRPAGTDNNVTSCGTYTANGRAYGSAFYFVDNNRFLAGYSDAAGAACIGLVVKSWSSTRIVFAFGNSYGTFTDWWLLNGNGYAVSVKGAIWGDRVSRLT